MVVNEPSTGSATKIRILDAAEKLFGLYGFDATSLREITAEAKVNLAAVNYHFQSKDSLMDAAIERRMLPINHARFQMLDAAGPSPTVEQIVEAFLWPVLTDDVVAAVPLVGRVLSQPNQFFERVYQKHLLQVIDRFSEAIGVAVPGLIPIERFWRLQFMAGCMVQMLALSAVLPRMSGGPVDRGELMGRMIDFISAGLRAPATAGSIRKEF